MTKEQFDKAQECLDKIATLKYNLENNSKLSKFTNDDFGDLQNEYYVKVATRIKERLSLLEEEFAKI